MISKPTANALIRTTFSWNFFLGHLQFSSIHRKTLHNASQHWTQGCLQIIFKLLTVIHVSHIPAASPHNNGRRTKFFSRLKLCRQIVSTLHERAMSHVPRAYAVVQRLPRETNVRCLTTISIQRLHSLRLTQSCRQL